jgi:hypothetical protein
MLIFDLHTLRDLGGEQSSLNIKGRQCFLNEKDKSFCFHRKPAQSDVMMVRKVL